jgi:hypothetical protein
MYAHLSNTQWGTNFPQWQEGDFTWRINLYPHTDDWLNKYIGDNIWKDVGRARREFSRGPDWIDCFFADTWQVPLAMRPRHDGRGLVIRLWDPVGTQRDVSLDIRGKVSALWQCDLMERPVERLPHRYEEDAGWTRASIPITPHGIVTLLVEFDQPADLGPGT